MTLRSHLRAAGFSVFAELARKGVQLAPAVEAVSVRGWSVVVELVPAVLGNHKLSKREAAIMEAIGDEVLTGEEIARRTIYSCDSAFRETLAGLVRRGLLAKRVGGGYLRTAMS